LRLTGADGKPVTLNNLPMRSAKFERCNWIGFVGADAKEAAFYVDNFIAE
jgi:hypothetical protein